MSRYLRLKRDEKGQRALSCSGGFTLIELLVTVSLIAILCGVAAFEYKALNNPQNAAAMEVMTFIKQTRSKAIASTYAYTIKPASSTELVTTYGSTCSAEQTSDNVLKLSLPDGSHLTSTTWSICYEARGLSRNAVDIGVAQESGSRTVQVVLGGAVRVL